MQQENDAALFPDVTDAAIDQERRLCMEALDKALHHALEAGWLLESRKTNRDSVDEVLRRTYRRSRRGRCYGDHTALAYLLRHLGGIFGRRVEQATKCSQPTDPKIAARKIWNYFHPAGPPFDDGSRNAPPPERPGLSDAEQEEGIAWGLPTLGLLGMIRYGLEIEGYPICCVLAFAEDLARCRAPGQLRGSIEGRRQRGPLLAGGDCWTSWVPCAECLKASQAGP
jgi:hypothetical protein